MLCGMCYTNLVKPVREIKQIHSNQWICLFFEPNLIQFKH